MSLQNAIDDYVAVFGEIGHILSTLQDWADCLGYITPDEVDFAKVGSAQKVLNDLEEISRFLQLDDAEED